MNVYLGAGGIYHGQDCLHRPNRELHPEKWWRVNIIVHVIGICSPPCDQNKGTSQDKTTQWVMAITTP